MGVYTSPSWVNLNHHLSVWRTRLQVNTRIYTHTLAYYINHKPSCNTASTVVQWRQRVMAPWLSVSYLFGLTFLQCTFKKMFCCFVDEWLQCNAVLCTSEGFLSFPHLCISGISQYNILLVSKNPSGYSANRRYLDFLISLMHVL